VATLSAPAAGPRRGGCGGGWVRRWRRLGAAGGSPHTPKARLNPGVCNAHVRLPLGAQQPSASVRLGCCGSCGSSDHPSRAHTPHTPSLPLRHCRPAPTCLGCRCLCGCEGPARLRLQLHVRALEGAVDRSLPVQQPLPGERQRRAQRMKHAAGRAVGDGDEPEQEVRGAGEGQRLPAGLVLGCVYAAPGLARVGQGGACGPARALKGRAEVRAWEGQRHPAIVLVVGLNCSRLRWGGWGQHCRSI
jgi:hypothetical protein